METSTSTTLIIFAVNIVISGLVGYGSAAFKIGEYKNKVETLESTVGRDDHGGLRRTIGDLREKVAVCETSLKEREPYTKRKSPISLSDRGESFLKDSGGQKFVDDNVEELTIAVDSKSPKTAYDIQEFSREVLDEMKDQDKFNGLKDFLFKEGLELGDLITVMGIYLRDKILSAKGMAPEEIDKTDPSKNDTH